jgi:Uma2 family endonuclease
MNDVAFKMPAGEMPARFTIDQFLELLATDIFKGGEKLELVEGVIVSMSPAQSTHVLLQRQVFLALHAIFGDGLDGYVAHFELTLQLGSATLRDGDVGVCKAFDTSVRFPDPATVLLIVEISHSTLAQDMNAKRDDYARAGIPHYWVVDPASRLVHTMTLPVEGDYTARQPYKFGEPIPVPGTDETISIGLA